MSKQSVLLHCSFLKKDPLGELNFCISKLYNVVYAFITTILCRLRLSFVGVLWQLP